MTKHKDAYENGPRDLGERWAEVDKRRDALDQEMTRIVEHIRNHLLLSSATQVQVSAVEHFANGEVAVYLSHPECLEIEGQRERLIREERRRVLRRVADDSRSEEEDGG